MYNINVEISEHNLFNSFIESYHLYRFHKSDNTQPEIIMINLSDLTEKNNLGKWLLKKLFVNIQVLELNSNKMFFKELLC